MLGQRLGLLLVGGLALTSVACAPRGEAKQPMGHVEVRHLEGPDDAPEEAKTVEVSYVFDRDVVNKDFDKSFKDGFDKKGLRVDEEISAHAHFGVTNAKITGTVTYVKKKMGRFSIIEANLVAEAHYEADVQLDLDVKVQGDTKKASDKDWDKTATGGKAFTLVKNVMPTNIPIAGPLFLHAHFDLTAACDLGIEGQVHATTGVGIKGDVHLAAKYKKAGFDKENGKKSRFAFEAKTPNFELAPRPYLKVEGKQQSLKGKCSLQPTAVLLLERSVGAKLIVEPWIEIDASRPSARSPWKLDAQAGVSLNAATDIELFGRQLRKPKEFTLFEVALTKKGDAMGRRLPGPTQPSVRGASPTEIARATPAEDLRTAGPEVTTDPFAADDNAGRPTQPGLASSAQSSAGPSTATPSADALPSSAPPPSAPPPSSALAISDASRENDASTARAAGSKPASESTDGATAAAAPEPAAPRSRGKKPKGAGRETSTARVDAAEAPADKRALPRAALGKLVGRKPNVAAGAATLIRSKVRKGKP